MNTPTTPGFYWARWLKADPDTDDNGEGCVGVNAEWEVVEVYENSLDEQDDEYLRVCVCGVARSQSIENFEWGEGPITKGG